MTKQLPLPGISKNIDADLSPEIQQLIQSICKANGFSLARTKEVRRKLREIARSSRAAKGNILFTPVSDITRIFCWASTKEGWTYWRNVANTLEIAEQTKQSHNDS